MILLSNKIGFVFDAFVNHWELGYYSFVKTCTYSFYFVLFSVSSGLNNDSPVREEPQSTRVRRGRDFAEPYMIKVFEGKYLAISRQYCLIF